MSLILRPIFPDKPFYAPLKCIFLCADVKGAERMPTEGEGTFHIYRSKGIISIRSKVWRDSAFPFNDKDDLTVIVKESGIFVKKKEKKGQKKLNL
jgi:hypothetical protein